MRVTEHRPLPHRNNHHRARNATGPAEPATVVPVLPRTREPIDSSSVRDANAEHTLKDIANTAAHWISLLDELRQRQPERALAGPNPTRVMLDQAAAAAADLHMLVMKLSAESD